MNTWHELGERSAITPNTPLGATVPPPACAAIGAPALEARIAVFEVDGQLHATQDLCPHAYALLSQGFVKGREVQCPLHGATFDVTTGQFLYGEPCDHLKTFPVRVVNERVQVDLAALL